MMGDMGNGASSKNQHFGDNYLNKATCQFI